MKVNKTVFLFLLFYVLMIPNIVNAAFFKLPTGNLINNRDEINNLPGAIANRVAETLLVIAYPLAFIGIVYSAYTLISSLGDASAFAKAKKNITYIISGIFIIAFASIIFNLVYSLFGLGS